MRVLYFFFLYMFLSCSQIGTAQKLFQIKEEDKLYFIGKDCQILWEKDQHFNFEEVQKSDSLFTLNAQNTIQLGGFNPKSCWLKFDIERVNDKNDEDLDISCDLDFAPFLIDSISVYAKNAQNEWQEKKKGVMFALSNRDDYNFHSTHIIGNGIKRQTIYIHAYSNSGFPLKIRLGYSDFFDRVHDLEDYASGLFFGAIFFVIIVNMLMCPAQRDILYLWYGLYLTSMLCMFGYKDGYVHSFFANFGIETPNYLMSILSCSPSIFAGFFAIRFLDLKSRLPWFHRLFVSILLFNCFIFILCIILPNLAVQLLMAITPFIILVGVFGGIASLRSGNKSALFFLGGWCFILIGMIISVADNMGWYENSTYSMRFVLYMCLTLEAISLTFGLIERVSRLRREKEHTQELLVDSLKQQKEQARLHNETLEERIIERTQVLRNTLDLLEENAHALSKSKRQLEMSNKELTEFAHIVSHDLKAPLRTITSFVQLFERKNRGKLDERDEEYMNFIVSGAAQSTKLIEDMLSYAKLDKNLGEPTPLSMQSLIQSVILKIDRNMREKNAEIVLGEMPMIKAHESLLSVLFQNLILNAIKYNESAPPKVFVTVQLEAEYIVFSVADNGIGIPPQYQDEIFRMFRRLHTADKYEGSGIGLAFCKRIVDFYGGTIQFAPNASGFGTTFNCYFPISMALSDDASIREEALQLVTNKVDVSPDIIPAA